MEYTKLPKVKMDKHLELSHFPNRFYAAVFRLWETCGAERIATALSVTKDVVEKAAKEMGLPPQQCLDKWMERGYISIIKAAWHILPYSQLLKLLDWTEDKLALCLKEDDFLYVKLGGFKPYCEDVVFEELTSEGREQLNEIKKTMEQYFSDMHKGVMPFDFFKDVREQGDVQTSEGIRMVYSYCGLYASVLENDISMSYPDALLETYKKSGINAIWLPVVLYQMVPFPFDESISDGWQMRQKRLSELVEKAGKCGIKVYLYLNEPRCMPLDFFDSHPELLGAVQGDEYGALCTSVSAVLEYLRYSVRELCQGVPGLGGFVTITCSENLTHCKSDASINNCPRCKDIPAYKLVADVLCAISEESRKVDPNIKTIAWTWAWHECMTSDEILKCIDLLPKEVIIQSNSEVHKEFEIGGVKGQIEDYSMSIPGPGTMAKSVWDYAKKKGHQISAKIQVNVTWECSTVPYLPVFDLVREHMTNLREEGVEHLMLSWTLGGCPSVNLKIATECIKDPSEEKYIKLLQDEYGEYASKVKKAASFFSNAFREFPFHIANLYLGPTNAGPSNPLYLEQSGFEPTMTGFSYDGLDAWRADYPRDVFINQFKKLAQGWEKGLEEIKDMPDCDFKQIAYASYAILCSSYVQSAFINERDAKNINKMKKLADKEKELTLLLYNMMQKNNLIGYEAANHYYYTKSMLAEKVLNCEYIINKLDSMK